MKQAVDFETSHSMQTTLSVAERPRLQICLIAAEIHTAITPQHCAYTKSALLVPLTGLLWGMLASLAW
jgi:hypothetical protein